MSVSLSRVSFNSESSFLMVSSKSRNLGSKELGPVRMRTFPFIRGGNQGSSRFQSNFDQKTKNGMNLTIELIKFRFSKRAQKIKITLILTLLIRVLNTRINWV